jgi:hypothetical protein
MVRGTTVNAYVRDISRLESGTNAQGNDTSNIRNYGSSITDHFAGFVAETSALQNDRRRTMDQQTLGMNSSFSITPTAFTNQRRISGSSSVQAPFGMENLETDDLADFMVDTDDEDEPSLNDGRIGNRGLGKSVLQPRDAQVEQDVQEVPETPLKAR